MKQTLLSMLLMAASLAAFAQGYQVKGTVQDALGPVIGATVLEQGTSNGTSTGLDGEYVLTVSSPDAVVEVSCIGYAAQTFKASDVPGTISLSEDTTFLDEVVVVGYGTQKAKDLTAPISTVKGEELSRQISGNALGALQGKASGVRIIQSGAPGASPSITIRGTGSLGSYATPLYVVDGVFVDDIGFVSTDDIQDMTILKDASAAAIYGVRAANGVIIITTKKGSKDHTEISYGGYLGIQVPVNVMKLASRDQYVELLNEANASDPSYVPKSASSYPVSTDWYSTLLRKYALTHNHSLDISGGSEKTSYALGLGYFYQDGIMDSENFYRRLNFRTRVDQKVKDWLDVGINVILSNYNRKDPATGAFTQAFVNPPVYPVYNEANTEAYPVDFDSPQRYGFGGSYGNPYAEIYYNDNRTKGFNVVSSTYAELKFLSGHLRLRTAYNMEYQGYHSASYNPEHLVYGTQGTKISKMGKTFGQRFKHIIDNTLTWADQKGRHSWSLMAGQSTRVETLTGLSGSATDVPDIDDQSRYLGLGSTKDITVTDLNPGPYRYNGLSFFTRGTYNWADRYLATVTMRADASSKYNEKWGFFPSVGIGWVLSEEPFMKNVPAFEYLKLRASWGLLGNDNIPANSSAIIGASGVGSSAVFNDVLVDGVGAQTVFQNYLKWEVVNEFDVGADFSFLTGRLTGELDYYNRTTHNVVFNVPIATGGGTGYLLANNGVVRNSGFEFNISWKDKVSEDLSYNVGLNLTTVKNRVIRLDGRDNIPGATVRGNFTTLTQKGYPIGSFWGYEIEGVYSSTKDAMLDDVSQAIKAAGYFKYKDQNDDLVIDEADKVFLGSPIPWLMTGLDFGLNWKGLDVGISLYGQFGNKILNAKRMNRGTFSDGNYDLDFYKNAWRKDAKSDKYPSAEAYTEAYTQQANSFFVEPGWFLRIQNVQAGWTFSNFGKMDFIRSLRVYISAQRPFTYFPYNGFTTEIGGSPIDSGIDTATHPMQAIYTVGLKVNFK
ncbi:MAG: TonB-dependent receptor [Bacteroidales bacterium]|nr:TonB-dependent receptor [Bacteroidales bacterium]